MKHDYKSYLLKRGLKPNNYRSGGWGREESGNNVTEQT